MNHRVFVTGIGVITPIGIGRERLWRSALAGTRGVRALDRFDPAPYRSKVAGQVEDFDPAAFLERRALQRSERFAQFSIAAARMTSSTLSGRESIGMWLVSSSTVVAPIRFADAR